MPVRLHVGLTERKRMPRRHRELQANEIEPRDQLGHAVLHLQAGVHLEEVEPAGIDEVLHGAGPRVVDRSSDRDGGVPHPPSGRIGHEDGRRLLHHLLVATLHGALPVEEVQDGALGVPHDLDLDVTGGLEIPLQEHLVGTEGGRRLTLGRGHRIGELARRAHEAHAAATAAG